MGSSTSRPANLFRGIANLSVDAKGRIAVPKIHRDKLEGEGISDLTVTLALDKCLLIYPREQWGVVEEAINDLPTTDEYHRALQRHCVGHATEVELDGNGRILIPSLLRDYAGIDKKAVMLGQGKKLELWSEEEWAKTSSSHPPLLASRRSEERSEQVKALSI